MDFVEECYWLLIEVQNSVNDCFHTNSIFLRKGNSDPLTVEDSIRSEIADMIVLFFSKMQQFFNTLNCLDAR